MQEFRLGRSHPSGGTRAPSVLVPLGALIAILVALVVTWESGTLAASEAGSDDADGDGIPDLYESVLMTSPVRADHDDDGYWDSEELARQSQPASADSIPSTPGLSVGMTARGGGGSIHLLVAMYYTDRRTDNKIMLFGMRSGGRILSVPTSTMTANSSMRVISRPEHGNVMLLDITLPPSLIAASGSASYFVVVGEVGRPRYAAAAVVDVMLSDGIPILYRRAGAMSRRASDLEVLAPEGFASSPSDALFIPIPFIGTYEIPTTWEGGRICFRTVETIGSMGSVLVNEVISADCRPGFDSHCDANCANSVGRTFETVDPVTLVGG